jgi:hypothetical protein
MLLGNGFRRSLGIPGVGTPGANQVLYQSARALAGMANFCKRNRNAAQTIEKTLFIPNPTAA